MMQTWKQTFHAANGTVLSGASVNVYLAGTTVAARIFDVNDVLYDTAPQLTTDADGFIEFSFDSDDFSTGQLFDINVVCNFLCNTVDDVDLKSIKLLQDTEGGLEFQKTFYQAAEPTDSTTREGDIWIDTDDDNALYTYTSGSWVAIGGGGTPGAPGADAGNWSSNLVFSATDYDTVAWASGVINTADTNYSIATGNTGNMSAATPYYMYLKPSVSITVLQITTTAADAVGVDQILVGVAQASTSPISAGFQVFGGRGGIFITADNIAAASITADRIVANSLTSTQINTSGLTVAAIEDQGSLATLSSVGTGQIDTTVISGGKIVTGLLTADNITTGTMSAARISAGILSCTNDAYWNLATSVMWMPNVSGTTAAFIGLGSTNATTCGRLWGNVGSIGMSSYNNGVFLRTGNPTGAYLEVVTDDVVLTSTGTGQPSVRIGSATASITAPTTTITASTQFDMVVGSKTICFDSSSPNQFFRPTVAAGVGVGNSTTWFWDGYFSNVYFKGTHSTFDVIDDLDALHKIESDIKGNVKPLSLPEQVLDLERLKEQIKRENGDLLTDAEIDASIRDEDDMGHLVGINAGNMTFLLEGAIRQLDTEIDAEMQQVFTWLSDLEKRLKTIEPAVISEGE